MSRGDMAAVVVANARQARADAEAIDYNKVTDWDLAQHVGTLSETVRQLLAVLDGVDPV